MKPQREERRNDSILESEEKMLTDLWHLLLIFPTG